MRCKAKISKRSVSSSAGLRGNGKEGGGHPWPGMSRRSDFGSVKFQHAVFAAAANHMKKAKEEFVLFSIKGGFTRDNAS